jgi:hypothetical protein
MTPSAPPPVPYEKLLPEILAACVCATGEASDAATEEATAVLEDDTCLADKFGAFSVFEASLLSMSELASSGTPQFKVRIAKLAQAVKALKHLEKGRVTAVLTRLEGVAGALDKNLSRVALEKLKAAAESPLATEAPRTLRLTIARPPDVGAIEEYVLRTGDPTAIRTVQEARGNVRALGAKLRLGAANNSVLKTALGVFAGVIAAELVLDVARRAELKRALGEFNDRLIALGGPEHLALDPAEMRTQISPEAADEIAGPAASIPASLPPDQRDHEWPQDAAQSSSDFEAPEHVAQSADPGERQEFISAAPPEQDTFEVATEEDAPVRADNAGCGSEDYSDRDTGNVFDDD